MPDYRLSISFTVSLPDGAEPPTPTSEAAEAAALACCGPCSLSDVSVHVAASPGSRRVTARTSDRKRKPSRRQ